MRRWYGAGAGHLLALTVCFGISAAAIALVAADAAWPVMLTWFLAAVVAHDLVLFPLYAGVDRALGTIRRRRLVNHLRVPLLGAGLTFLIFFPGIVGQGRATLRAASGLDQEPYLVRWLALVAAIAAASALVYAVRRSPDREQLDLALRQPRDVGDEDRDEAGGDDGPGADLGERRSPAGAPQRDHSER